MLKKLFQNTCKPQGLGGKFILKMMNNGHAKLADWAISHIQLKEDDSVLDIGCGGGANIQRFLKTCSKGFVAGIDYSDESVQYSIKKNSEYIGKNCEIKKGNVSNIPYENDKFDMVTAFETVYFWPDLKQNFKEVHRVLKPNGYFMICCEEGDPESSIWPDKIEGMKVYSIMQLSNVLKSSGFKIVEAEEKENSKWICLVGQK